MERYRGRLKGKNLQYLSQLRRVTKAIASFFAKHDKLFEKATGSGGGAGGAGGAATGASSSSSLPSPSSPSLSPPPPPTAKTVFQINDLLFALGIDNVNLLKLER